MDSALRELDCGVISCYALDWLSLAIKKVLWCRKLYRGKHPIFQRSCRETHRVNTVKVGRFLAKAIGWWQEFWTLCGTTLLTQLNQHTGLLPGKAIQLLQLGMCAFREYVASWLLNFALGNNLDRECKVAELVHRLWVVLAVQLLLEGVPWVENADKNTIAKFNNLNFLNNKNDIKTWTSWTS